MNAGYGVLIIYPDQTKEELYNSCGAYRSNYEAEAIGLEAATHHLSNIFQLFPSRLQNIVMFSDSKSVLEALENETHADPTLESLSETIDNFLKTHSVKLTLQWIPGHSNIHGNERADKLAKQGTTCEQTQHPVTLKTSKQIIKANTREEWMNRWAMGKTGRS